MLTCNVCIKNENPKNEYIHKTYIYNIYIFEALGIFLITLYVKQVSKSECSFHCAIRYPKAKFFCKMKNTGVTQHLLTCLRHQFLSSAFLSSFS